MRAEIGGHERPHPVAEWLHRHAQPGDLLLTASRDNASRVIRVGTLGKYSHVGVIRGSGVVIEAYDRAMSVSEQDGGVFEIEFGALADRGRLSRVGLLRPASIDPGKFDDAARQAIDHSPPFASVGALMLACLGLTTWKNRETLFSRALTRFLPIVGDGPVRVHCSEFAARLYHSADVRLHIHKPRLGPYFSAARKEQELPASPPAHPDRRAWSLSKSRPDGRFSSRSRGVLQSLSNRVRESTPHDWMDFVMPSDFPRSPSFHPVGHVFLKRGDWTVVGGRV